MSILRMRHACRARAFVCLHPEERIRRLSFGLTPQERQRANVGVALAFVSDLTADEKHVGYRKQDAREPIRSQLVPFSPFLPLASLLPPSLMSPLSDFDHPSRRRASVD